MSSTHIYGSLLYPRWATITGGISLIEDYPPTKVTPAFGYEDMPRRQTLKLNLPKNKPNYPSKIGKRGKEKRW